MTHEELKRLKEMALSIEYTEGDIRAAHKLTHGIHGLLFENNNHDEISFHTIDEYTFNKIKGILINFHEVKLHNLKQVFNNA